VRAPDLRGALFRLGFVRAGLLLLFLAVAARAAHLCVVDGRGARRGVAQSETRLVLPPERGTLFDRNGAELALSVEAPSVYASPAAIRDIPATARALAKALGGESRRIAERLRSAGSFVYLARWIDDERAQRVRALGLPGIGIVEEPRRVYPHRELAAQLIGFANIDGAGVRGVEEQEDEWLRGRARSYAVERDARGRLLAEAGMDPRATAGGDVALSLDAAFQADAESALQDAMRESRARAGFVITLDPRSGDVLSLAERPTFDPNRFREQKFAETRSRAFLDAFEPGSTFKIFLISTALDTAAIRPSDVFDCEQGRFQVPGKVIRDSHPHGLLDVASVLRVSSNIGATKIVYRLGSEPYWDRLRAFGFGEATGSGFPQESAGLLRSWHAWRPVDEANIAFGQGVNVTGVQLAAAAGAIANGGVWIRPRLVSARRAPGGPWQAEPPAPSRRVVRAEVAATVLGMMEGVVGPDGTGRRAALPGIRVAGKTGTAQKLDPVTGAYASNRYVAWFVGIAPADDPRLVVVAALDEPQGLAHTGGAVSAPLFAKVAAAQLARLGILTTPEPPSAPATAVAAEPPAGGGSPAPDEAESALAHEGGRVLMPDFRGLSVREVRRLTEGTPLAIEILGEGRAVSQDPEPGTIVAGATTRVRVTFVPGAGEG